MITRRAHLVVPVLAAVLGACSSEVSSVGSDDLRAEDAVLCRELGGGWVHVRYEVDDAALDDLQRPDGPSAATVARRERMPSRLAELRATDP